MYSIAIFVETDLRKNFFASSYLGLGTSLVIASKIFFVEHETLTKKQFFDKWNGAIGYPPKWVSSTGTVSNCDTIWLEKLIKLLEKEMCLNVIEFSKNECISLPL